MNAKGVVQVVFVYSEEYVNSVCTIFFLFSVRYADGAKNIV